MRPTLTRMALLLLSASTLTACAAGERLSYVGQAPPMSPMENIPRRDTSPSFAPSPRRAAWTPIRARCGGAMRAASSATRGQPMSATS